MPKVNTVILLHGSGEEQDHEERFLSYEAKHAREKKVTVHQPKIPNFDGKVTPTREGFHDTIAALLSENKINPDRTAVVAHSLGGNGWLHFLERNPHLVSCYTFLVATPYDCNLPEVSAFFPTPLITVSKRNIPRWMIVGSDNDDVINEPPRILANRLHVRHTTINNAGHFMPHALTADTTKGDYGKKWMQVRRKIGLEELY